MSCRQILQRGLGLRRMCVQHPLHRSVRLRGRQAELDKKVLPEDQLLVHGAEQLFTWERVRQMGIPKGLDPGRRFGYFLAEEKVPRRRPTQSNRQIAAPFRPQGDSPTNPNPTNRPHSISPCGRHFSVCKKELSHSPPAAASPAPGLSNIKSLLVILIFLGKKNKSTSIDTTSLITLINIR